jgi:hypothetical protein
MSIVSDFLASLSSFILSSLIPCQAYAYRFVHNRILLFCFVHEFYQFDLSIKRSLSYGRVMQAVNILQSNDLHPHRPGRAGLPHPVPQSIVSLRVGVHDSWSFKGEYGCHQNRETIPCHPSSPSCPPPQPFEPYARGFVINSV